MAEPIEHRYWGYTYDGRPIRRLRANTLNELHEIANQCLLGNEWMFTYDFKDGRWV